LALLRPLSKEYRELSARLLRNQGHIEFESGHVPAAIERYRQSLALFQETGDVEHIGTSQLSLAKALIEQSCDSFDEAYSLLKNAGNAFSRIGWLEGQARVQEQLARYSLASAARAEKREQEALLREALAALDSSEVMFERVHSGRFHGRLDELRAQWRKAIELLHS
jgi:tetratricopeptide (TPR) repeat protein